MNQIRGARFKPFINKPALFNEHGNRPRLCAGLAKTSPLFTMFIRYYLQNGPDVRVVMATPQCRSRHQDISDLSATSNVTFAASVAGVHDCPSPCQLLQENASVPYSG